MHAAVLAAPGLRETAKRLNPELDVSPMDNPAVKPLEFTLARSATQFETKKQGLLPPSHVMMGKNTYDVKDYVKTHFDNVEYSDLLFPGPHGPKSITKTAWVVPIASQTASTGTLADSPHARRDGHRGGSRRGGRRQRRGGRARRQRARRRRG